MNRLQKVTLRTKQAIFDAAGRCHVGVSYFGSERRSRIMHKILAIKNEREMAMTPMDAFQLYSAASSTAKLDGAAAEVGVFRGASARLILEALPDKTLHLCDTFEGMPDSQDGLDKGMYAGSLESVRSYLNSPQVRFHKGYFPRDTAHEIENERFAFVNLDVDYFDGTLGALEFFWPRMVRGGVILTHDYDYLPGPTKAFKQFFSSKTEPVIELPGIQALVVKGN
jgi:hypothetical protein